GHAAADSVERAVQSALPEADVVVHVEPIGAADADVRERAHAAALDVPRVREVHNVSVVSVDSGTELSLHLKLPGDLSLKEAHAIAEEVERAIERAAPEVSSVRTHLEPLGEEAAGTEVAGDAATVRRIVRAELGVDPAELRFVDTDEGLVAYLTLRLGSDTLADAHADASRIEELIRRERPEIADVVVANPAAIKAVDDDPGVPEAEQLERVAAIVGADGAIGGFTPLVEWVAPQLRGAKQRDFALTLGPVVTTPDEGMPPGVDWERLVAHAAENTTPYPGHLIARCGSRSRAPAGRAA